MCREGKEGSLSVTLLNKYLTRLELLWQFTGGLNPRAFRRRHLKLPRAVGGGEAYGPTGPPEGVASGEELLLRASKNLLADTGAWVKVLYNLLTQFWSS